MQMEIDEFDPILRNLTHRTLKLDIGSGGPIFQRKDVTWTTVDKYATAQVVADMWNLPYADEEVEEIWSSHALEHVPRQKVYPTLKEWYRVLQRGGRCTVQVPDLDYVAQLWLKEGAPALGFVFGSQEHPGEYHKTGWNLPSLREDLEYIGFTVDKAETLWTPDYSQYSIRIEAHK